MGLERGLWFFHWCLDGVGQVWPKMLFVVRPPFSPFFDKEEESYLLFVCEILGSILSVPVGASRLEVSAAPCSRYIRGYRETQKLTTYSSLSREISRQLFFFFPPFKDFLCS